MWQHDLQLPMIIMCLIFQLELLTKEAHISSQSVSTFVLSNFLPGPLPSDSAACETADIFPGFLTCRSVIYTIDKNMSLWWREHCYCFELFPDGVLCCTYSILAGGTPLSGQHLPNSPGRASICCMPVGYCVATPHRISAQCTGRSRAQIKNIGAAHTVVPVDRAVIDGDVELLHHPPDEPGAGNISSGKILSRRGITAAAPQ
jgi:hypothetical protein